MINFPTQAELLRMRYGRDVEIVDSPKEKKVRCPDGHEQSFPYYVASWRDGDTTKHVLIEPKPKLVHRNYGWPFTTHRYEEDAEAMRAELAGYINDTKAPQDKKEGR
jgi:hypothetical protein